MCSENSVGGWAVLQLPCCQVRKGNTDPSSRNLMVDSVEKCYVAFQSGDKYFLV